MRKNVVLLGLVLAGGVGGFLARRWQLASAYAPETGLFTHGAPATLVLMGLAGLSAAVSLLLALRLKEGPEDFLPAFGSRETGQMTALAAAGILLCASGIFGMRDGLLALRLWQGTPALERQPTQFTFAAALAVTALLCVAAGGGVLLLGKMAYRGKLTGAGCRMAPLPAIAGLFWLFVTYLSHSTEPVLMKYGFELFAALFLTLAHYYFAGFLFGKAHPRRAVFCALLGTVLGLTSLADGPGLFNAAVTLAFSLSALGFAYGLLGGPWPERMPPAEEENTDIT